MKATTLAAAIAASLTVSAGTPALAQELVYWGSGGGWDILVDPTLGNGCLIQAEYQNGVLVRVGFDLNEGAGYLTAFHENWGDIVEGESYGVAFDLDGQSYDGVAQGIYLNDVPGADIYFDNPDFLWDIAARQTLTLYNEYGEVMAIDLTGTMVALEGAMECQDDQG
ncbi:hypothetical protein [Thalassovita sp.]|uniref:hypothetical protein n=1 Tax=Thalassovita sp. TaxID=1979401 RepID=UPI0028826056|nr:hypothetical protein [Thalassovita sp.]MDF1802506.1 hypothetical protein [Thalassovita sp.]